MSLSIYFLYRNTGFGVYAAFEMKDAVSSAPGTINNTSPQTKPKLIQRLKSGAEAKKSYNDSKLQTSEQRHWAFALRELRDAPPRSWRLGPR
jgi:hypothetical protein